MEKPMERGLFNPVKKLLGINIPQTGTQKALVGLDQQTFVVAQL